MIADSTFLNRLIRERESGIRGSARSFLNSHRPGLIHISVISIGEIAVLFETTAQAWVYFQHFKIYPLHRGIVDVAADLDRELSARGKRLGENDNWIAGFCLFYREPIITLDRDFERVPGLRRIAY
jgi:predicted nucleic acid-binding protein